MEHGKPDCLRKCGNRPARAGDRQAGMGGWKKRMPSCNEADRGSKFALTRKSADFQQVLNHEKGLKRCYRERTVRRQPEAVDGIPGDGKRWNSIIWKEIFKIVNRIQARIVKAVKAGDTKKVRGLQRLLRRSKAAKLMAVRRVTSNRGKFDFLGFNIRKYKGKLLTKPSKSSIASIKEKIRETVKTNKTIKTQALIEKLNPVIRGWGNYFRHSASKRTFTSIDHAVFEMTWKWAKRRHPGKSLKWIKSKYFQQEKNRNWVFKEKRNRHSLFKMDSIPIRRHIKVKGEANPYDPKWHEYFTKSAIKLRKQSIKTRQDILWIEQKGICPACQTELDKGEEWHTHHLKPKSKGGKDNLENLILMHSVCRRQIHANPNTGCLLPDASRHLK
ncbi:Group II intron reverse transcriptase/maturase [Desulfonema limicola]|uniref:Group II intron reverse transcriptase/maturase n=1 Tax=Desulfonema limicola TaxID=45656 RepID=A0A975GHY9_9BACT|nr:group II intron maturase-specific domain-containing protein [Desulfonema limicola]QTA82065.1 Group II intron reverse transcriptase/maturase [Desulfonema limicola]